jgi:hypothetical protein
VGHVEAGRIAEPRTVVRDDPTEPLRIGGEAREVLRLRARVYRHPRVPVAKVLGPVLVEMVDEMRK